MNVGSTRYNLSGRRRHSVSTDLNPLQANRLLRVSYAEDLVSDLLIFRAPFHGPRPPGPFDETQALRWVGYLVESLHEMNSRPRASRNQSGLCPLSNGDGPRLSQRSLVCL